jgi:hypothetical protein
MSALPRVRYLSTLSTHVLARMKKSALLRALQTEIQRHSLSTLSALSADRGDLEIMPTVQNLHPLPEVQAQPIRSSE